MDISTGVADLHLHTTASDGTCTLEDRINQAHKIGLSTIAITDHDTIANSIEYRVTHQESLEIITGVEIRADVLGTKIELLGYYINPNDEPLEDRIKQVRAHRRDRNYKIINQLNEITSLDRSYTNIQSRIDGILGRPHIANILIERDIVDSVSTAFEKYLGSDGAAFVPMERVPADEIINTIHEAGGVVSLAHPGRIRTNTLDEIVERLVSDGLDAIEVYYPYEKVAMNGYADIDVEAATEISEVYDLISTGGSDCHGPQSGKFRIWNVRVNRDQLRRLRNLADTRCPL